MIEGIYSAAASMSALERWQETTSQNLASSSVAGFKKTEFSIEGLAGGKNKIGPERMLSSMDARMLPKHGANINLSPGQLEQTGKSTDFAVQGPGFFKVSGPGGEEAYTRDGEFHINPDGILVNKQGYPLIGEGGPIVIDPEAGPLTLNGEATLVQGTDEIAKLVVYDFADPAGLQRMDGGLFRASGADPAAVEKPVICQGAIETSNVAPLEEMVNLITVSRAYEASQRIITSHDALLGAAIQNLGNPLA